MQGAAAIVLTVCLELSPGLTLGGPERIVFEEVNAIWRPLGVAISSRHTSDHCHRLIVVKSDLEALPEDRSTDAALGWVPFVANHARQLVFLRPGRAHALVKEMGQGPRPEGLTQLLTARLLGRTLAHELGHVLMNTRGHAAAGLMRARYLARDLLKEHVSTYTLDAAERAALFAQAGEARVARR
jgi:hypothetical protein